MRQPEAQRVKAAFEIGAAAGAGVHGDPRGLIDDQYQPVAVEHALGKRIPEQCPAPSR